MIMRTTVFLDTMCPPDVVQLGVLLPPSTCDNRQRQKHQDVNRPDWSRSSFETSSFIPALSSRPWRELPRTRVEAVERQPAGPWVRGRGAAHSWQMQVHLPSSSGLFCKCIVQRWLHFSNRFFVLFFTVFLLTLTSLFLPLVCPWACFPTPVSASCWVGKHLRRELTKAFHKWLTKPSTEKKNNYGALWP